MLADLIEYARHQALLEQRDKDGIPAREHLEARAAKGNAAAIEELEGPPAPYALEYLYAWAMELVGRSGVGLDGLAPLAYTTIADWARLKDQHPEPHEVEALLALDAVIRHPELAARREEVAEPAVMAAWPSKKPEAGA